ncbi:alkaline phosphatase family protein [archaeon]|nr:alkaline phosphatase family protein [archaeon]
MQKRFIIVFIDGISYDLIKDIQPAYCPFIAKLIRKKGFRLQEYNPGIPTTTPYVQAGMFYGENSEIPGFRFVDKKGRKIYSLNEGFDANAIESSFRNKGILRGGSSYGNIFSGGALKNILVVSRLSELPTKFDSLHPHIDFLFSPFSFVPLLFYTAREFVIEMGEEAYGMVKGLLTKAHFNLLLPIIHPHSPFYRILGNVIWREFVTRGALRDIKNKVPFICVGYVGYDWVAHFKGPRKAGSLSVIKEIDNKIKKLYKAAGKRGYDFFVISDHGIVPSVPFQKVYYETLEEFIERRTKADTKTIKEKEESAILRYLVYQLKSARVHITFPIKWLVKILAKGIARPVVDRGIEILVWKNKKTIIIQESSSLANIYFNLSKEQLDLGIIEREYPYLIERLVSHPGIGMIIGRERKEIVVLSKTGRARIGRRIVFEGEDFLKVYGERKLLIKQIQKFANMKCAGDLIAIGKFDGKTIISFARTHLGSHDSFGGEQNRAFIISREKLPKITDSEQLYEVFRRYHKD